jgi:hypothetical protein
MCTKNQVDSNILLMGCWRVGECGVWSDLGYLGAKSEILSTEFEINIPY